MNTLDTRDLADERTELQQQILDDFNDKFNIQADDFDDIDSIIEEEKFEVTDDTDGFLEYWENELEQIEEINDLDDAVGSEWNYGVTLIDEYDFEEYCKELLIDCGYIPNDFPSWIEIDWEATANNVRQDYSEVDYQGRVYLFRA
jgi:hypothetical protein